MTITAKQSEIKNNIIARLRNQGNNQSADRLEAMTDEKAVKAIASGLHGWILK